MWPPRMRPSRNEIHAYWLLPLTMSAFHESAPNVCVPQNHWSLTQRYHTEGELSRLIPIRCVERPIIWNAAGIFCLGHCHIPESSVFSRRQLSDRSNGRSIRSRICENVCCEKFTNDLVMPVRFRKLISPYWQWCLCWSFSAVLTIVTFMKGNARQRVFRYRQSTLANTAL